MTRKKNYTLFIVLFCCFLLASGVLVSIVSAGNTDTIVISANISLDVDDIDVTDIGHSSVTITWETNGIADSTVEYGHTTGYGSTRTNPFMETDHIITLSRLAPGTLYHFRVVSSAQDGDSYVSTDYTFHTLSYGGGGGSAQAQNISSGMPMLVSEEGKVLLTYIVTTEEAGGCTASVTVPLGTIIHGARGEPVNSISVQIPGPGEVPPVPDGADYSFSGCSVKSLPDGATFSQPAFLKFHLSADQWMSLLQKAHGLTGSLSIRFYDRATSSWVRVPVTVDPSDFAVIAPITQIGTFGLFIDTTTIPVMTGNPVTPASVLAGTEVPKQTNAFPGPVGSVQWIVILSTLVIIVGAGAGYYFVTKKK
jgi:hypothetical protein